MSDLTTQVLITTDLDRTLIFSPAATVQLGGGRPRSPVEYVDGTLIAELSDEVAARLAAFDRSVEVAIVTTRTPDQLARVRLPRAGRFAIAANGGIVLIDGEPDRDWSRLLSSMTSDSASVLAAARLVERSSHEPWLVRIRVTLDQFIVVGIDPPLLTADRLDELQADFAPLGWRIAIVGRKLYLLPDGQTKEAAVVYLRDRLAAEIGRRPLHLAAGDTPLDLPMLQTADFGWTPRGSDLDLRVAVSAPVTVTDHSGHHGAEEILAGWADAIAATHP